VAKPAVRFKSRTEKAERKRVQRGGDTTARPPPPRRDGDAAARQAPPAHLPFSPPPARTAPRVAARRRRGVPLSRARLLLVVLRGRRRRRRRGGGGSGEELEADAGVPARRGGRYGRRFLRGGPAIPSLLPGYRLRRHRPTTRGANSPRLQFGLSPC